MGAKNHTRLTPQQRLSRGLTYTAVGPVDVTRGIVGLGAHSAQAGRTALFSLPVDRLNVDDEGWAADPSSSVE